MWVFCGDFCGDLRLCIALVHVGVMRFGVAFFDLFGVRFDLFVLACVFGAF